ncbi:hypothetical protein M7I_0465 [Glarea lozoyensis 74030]|uniref:Uncharacterized protein n=1 Tax=Glarea lozoyensis (strain ATCC 74030 / MF5533) TaxID=1104152 RepID=H0EDF6_GLAL7|nr:hypothetical protein M7I_0465 [Glarea lozoyensis 74030]
MFSKKKKGTPRHLSRADCPRRQILQLFSFASFGAALLSPPACASGLTSNNAALTTESSIVDRRGSVEEDALRENRTLSFIVQHVALLDRSIVIPSFPFSWSHQSPGGVFDHLEQ